MALSERCARVLALLDRVKRYDAIVRNDSFSPDALNELRNNAKTIIEEAKVEIDQIKAEVDNW